MSGCKSGVNVYIYPWPISFLSPSYYIVPIIQVYYYDALFCDIPASHTGRCAAVVHFKRGDLLKACLVICRLEHAKYLCLTSYQPGQQVVSYSNAVPQITVTADTTVGDTQSAGTPQLFVAQFGNLFTVRGKMIPLLMYSQGFWLAHLPVINCHAEGELFLSFLCIYFFFLSLSLSQFSKNLEAYIMYIASQL